MKKKIIFSVTVVSLCGILAFLVYGNRNEKKEVNNPTSICIENNGVKADLPYIENLKSLKDESDLIILCEGTNVQEKRDYKGIPSIVTTVKIKEVFKGTKDLKEVKVIQHAKLDVQPKSGEILIMFLMKGNGIDNPDCYGVVGAGQGIYVLEVQDNINSKNTSSSNYEEAYIKPQAIKNDNILKELNGKYKDIKNKLK
ncbi:hypothetical protein [Clostridium hydrogeniformans]|uniref:hypothetical protein n=1 Tax=Clostridium hydrogeniformans TaxID=349933 RepID=UPI0004882DDD|nr:hypothetical protein [Clostridium hydrogeniformans]